MIFQCKRVTQFGPKKVHGAVAKHTRKAKKKYILLSRVASPQARKAIRKHATWNIWDKEDISLRIRKLAKDEQCKLVDIFFPGQRLALLGETEPGPWLTTEEFYAPFMWECRPLNHTCKIVGKTEEIDLVIKGLSNEGVKIEGLDRPQVSRLIRLLTDGGVLFKRGGQYRLSPDVLADYIIEDNCIGLDGRSTGYGERVFEVAGDTYIKHIMLNLGKLDWRRSNGDPSNSKLLDGVWSKLRPESDYSDPHIAAVTAVAYYQPSRSLDFAEHLIREKKYLGQIPDLVRNTAYNLEYLPRVCECLWELGKEDTRVLHQHPEHSIRILSELCSLIDALGIVFCILQRFFDQVSVLCYSLIVVLRLSKDTP